MERRRFGGGGRGGGRGGFGGGRREGGFGGDRGGFGGGFRHDDKPKPIKIGEEYDVKITDVGAKGDGITKIENFIVFVAGTKKGEECRIRIKEVASRFAIGEKIGSAKGGAETEASAEEGEEPLTEESEEASSEEE